MDFFKSVNVSLPHPLATPQLVTEASELLWSHLRIHRERGVAKLLEIAVASPEAAFGIVSAGF